VKADKRPQPRDINNNKPKVITPIMATQVQLTQASNSTKPGSQGSSSRTTPRFNYHSRLMGRYLVSRGANRKASRHLPTPLRL